MEGLLLASGMMEQTAKLVGRQTEKRTRETQQEKESNPVFFPKKEIPASGGIFLVVRGLI